MNKYFHSIGLDVERCNGCTNCIKICPTEAIRIKNRKAVIISQRCIDCGECIKVCPQKAKKAYTGSMDIINEYKFKVALPSPVLYGQFDGNTNIVNKALEQLGFDYVFDVSRACQMIMKSEKDMLKNLEASKPLISSMCPAVVRLIQIRFPELLDNIIKIDFPMEIAAEMARQLVKREKGIKLEDIGIFCIGPCAAMMTNVKKPIIKGMTCENSELISSSCMKAAICGGEGRVIGSNEYMCVDGIQEVINILELIVNKGVKVEFLELAACPGGCIGGPLAVENRFVAKMRIEKLASTLKEFNMPNQKQAEANLKWEKELEHIPALKLDSRIAIAMQKMEEILEIMKMLPGLDCGTCGSPNCKALAEDVIMGRATLQDCKFKLKKKYK